MTERPSYIQEDVIIAPHTTFKIGGLADYFAVAKSEAELEAVVAWSQNQELPHMILGGGSNVVFADDGYRGLVIQIDIKGIAIEEKDDSVLVTAAAGEDWDSFVAYTIEQGFSGLENLSGIPGKVGASPVQNIGAYGVEVGERIVSVRVYDRVKNIFTTFQKTDCDFSYRHSIFKTAAGKDSIIVAVTFLLDTKFMPIVGYPDIKNFFEEHAPTLTKMREAIIHIRSKKFPNLAEVGTAGSFFKNPIITQKHFTSLRVAYPELSGYQHGQNVKVSAAWLIDNVAKAKGLVEGNVGTHVTQALVFVNYGQATAEEIDEFANKISDVVFEKTKITLEREVNFVK